MSHGHEHVEDTAGPKVISVGDRHPQMRRELGIQLVAVAWLERPHHDSLSRGAFRMPAMAFESCSQRDRSETSCFLPAAVNR